MSLGSGLQWATEINTILFQQIRNNNMRIVPCNIGPIWYAGYNPVRHPVSAASVKSGPVSSAVARKRLSCKWYVCQSLMYCQLIYIGILLYPFTKTSTTGRAHFPYTTLLMTKQTVHILYIIYFAGSLELIIKYTACSRVTGFNHNTIFYSNVVCVP